MKKLLTLLLGVAFIIVLYLGQSHWNQQLGASAKNKPHTTSSQTSTATLDKQNDDERGNEKQLLDYTSHWPAASVDRFKQTLKEKKPFTILFVGSPAIGSESDGTFPLVKEKLIETFGEKNIQVALKTYNSTSTQFIKGNKQEEIAAEHADLIVLEPFILLNNGLVLINDTLQHTTKIIDDIKASNPKTAFILQPSYPLYQAKIYPKQVLEFKNYAKKNQISYLDHWTAWPDSNKDSLKDYLLPDQSAPNEKGAQLWSEYILQFLISKSTSSK
ncbi:hypothetical protein BACCIP111895_03949 [Neobacillus rhizosphaerae]|uniref:SGNH hydrolase-type esterase domain-containing protein n=1 Tax=Neobacillus rhizosphaerae TaxID=2880965 RepID=A0ABN8KSB5_9BACI|nr:SGNH/GDSL hydrolase family protein [Neobacillus rhizosphaerae]CAH2716761.1 hypothetical protein BACCIP111895_03949 [Neobacillus rhizosphaerae]